jgi:hypothetical protein
VVGQEPSQILQQHLMLEPMRYWLQAFFTSAFIESLT